MGARHALRPSHPARGDVAQHAHVLRRAGGGAGPVALSQRVPVDGRDGTQCVDPPCSHGSRRRTKTTEGGLSSSASGSVGLLEEDRGDGELSGGVLSVNRTTNTQLRFIGSTIFNLLRLVFSSSLEFHLKKKTLKPPRKKKKKKKKKK